MPIFQSKRAYRAGNGKRFRDERRSSSPRAAGVSPPWFGEPNAVRSKSCSVRRRPTTRPRAAGVSPPWVSISQFTTALALTHGRPPRVAVPVAGAFASRLTTGGLRPPLLRCGANICPRNNDFCDAQTHIRPRAAGVSPPWVDKPASAETGAIRQQTADGVCADHRCGRVYRRHGANVAPESFMAHTGPDYNRVHWRHGGLTPPRSCVAVRTSAGETTIFAMHKRTFAQERRA
jgi:hypothetical protein